MYVSYAINTVTSSKLAGVGQKPATLEVVLTLLSSADVGSEKNHSCVDMETDCWSQPEG